MSLITDEVFKQNLDKAFREQGFLKKEREELIHNYLIDSFIDRDVVLDMEERKARDVVAKKKQDKAIPLEDEEQIEYVRWFRELFPNVDIAMFRNDGTRSFAERPKQLLMGLLKGASDLVICDWHLYVEMKRIKGSVISDDQYRFAERRIANGDFHFFAYGAEDAKKKTLAFYEEHIKNKNKT
jgi:hypothetical protein